jgi:hypothetical protein
MDISMLADEAMNLAYHGARALDQTFINTSDRDFGEGIATIEVNPHDMTRVSSRSNMAAVSRWPASWANTASYDTVASIVVSERH